LLKFKFGQVWAPAASPGLVLKFAAGKAARDRTGTAGTLSGVGLSGFRLAGSRASISPRADQEITRHQNLRNKPWSPFFSRRDVFQNSAENGATTVNAYHFGCVSLWVVRPRLRGAVGPGPSGGALPGWAASFESSARLGGFSYFFPIFSRIFGRWVDFAAGVGAIVAHHRESQCHCGSGGRTCRRGLWARASRIMGPNFSSKYYLTPIFPLILDPNFYPNFLS
jgi:hypothetical protein